MGTIVEKRRNRIAEDTMSKKPRNDLPRTLLVIAISGVQYFVFVLMAILAGRDFLKGTRQYA